VGLRANWVPVELRGRANSSTGNLQPTGETMAFKEWLLNCLCAIYRNGFE
jgi:hypothetical protein